MTTFDYAVCFATDLEGGSLPTSVAGRSIALVRTGVGPVNAAFALTRFLSQHEASTVISCGVGGAYPGSNFEPGEVLCAATETYGDLGAESPDGFLDMKTLGFPVIDAAQPIFTTIPMDVFPAPRRVPFVTCTMCTGTDATARAIVARTGGAVESMEGAAIAHVAKLMGVRVGEIRGISNPVGNRDKSKWRLREAAAAARERLIAWIEEGAC